MNSVAHPRTQKVAVKRTVRLAALPLNRNKRDLIRQLEHSYMQAKDRFLDVLAPTPTWGYLASKQGFREFANARDLYPKNVSVGAMNTWVRHIESVAATSELSQNLAAVLGQAALSCLPALEEPRQHWRGAPRRGARASDDPSEQRRSGRGLPLSPSASDSRVQ